MSKKPITPAELEARLLARAKRRPPAELLARYKADAGKGVSNKPSDNIMPHAVGADPDWLDALASLDRNGDPAPLTAMLVDAVPEPVKRHLADLFSRYTFQPKQGRKRTPSYGQSPQERRVASAVAQVKGYTKAGLSPAKVIEAVARIYCIDPTTLRNAVAGRRRSAKK